MKIPILALPVVLAITGVAAALGRPEARPADTPSLVVLITIDQFRGEYLTRYGTQLNGGIARLGQGGVRFTNAHHDHAITETAPGHATLLSGRFPRSTGIMMNAIGVADNAAPLVAGGDGPGASPARFRGTTLVDWMRVADKRTRSLSVSMKDRAAILPIGRSKTDVYWYSVDGRFLTSTYYRADLPAWVQTFNDRHLLAQHLGKTWGLLLPDSAYREPDSVAIEGGGYNVAFPHRLSDDMTKAGSEIRLTPFMDDLVLAFALHGVHSRQLGLGPQTDLLAVSLSATDVIGHYYGPDSREIHDQVLRVDRAVGAFLDSLYKLRDSSRITVVLTADHGVGTIPELAPERVRPRPRRVSVQPVMPLVRAKLREMKIDTGALGLDLNVLVSNRRAFRRPEDHDAAVALFMREARKIPGVARVDRFRQLLADTTGSAIARRWAHQFPAEGNVAAVVTLDSLSTWDGNVASHGSPYDHDSHVPIIFAGFGTAQRVRSDFVRTVDIAPTLARLLRVKPLERLDGAPLPLR
ncbi:alkaline phosphatase family protein [Gemmatimonas sp.]|jgi:predicted AlkP superfamily pyrophosphatase or phosphodiesterase|uniref:alkaline phosphatase family protein n=1 Tax=Gemmatimonas sp. TaxID=1962908 RepID=UPI003919D178